MFYIYLLSVVLFYVLFFSLAARYIKQFDDRPARDKGFVLSNVFH